MLIFIAGLTKRAQFPFSSWLPEAIAAPTPIRALVHSRTLVTAGVILILKFYVFSCNNVNLYYLILFGLITMFLAGLVSLREIDFKKIVALRTLRQIGILFFRLGLNNKMLTLIHLIRHAFFKSILFILVGAYLHYMFSQQDSRHFSGCQTYSLLVYLGTFICLLSLCGLFFLRGFFRKDLIFEAFIKRGKNSIVMTMFVFSLLFTFFYSFRLFVALNQQYVRNLSYLPLRSNLTKRTFVILLLSIVFSYFFV
jgi:NADH-ubiquinone oxidoreductase chain 5